MVLSVRRLAESFVGEVSGVDLARMDNAATAAVKEAWLAHKVLVFHDQHLGEDGLVAFAEKLGDVEIHLRQTRRRHRHGFRSRQGQLAQH